MPPSPAFSPSDQCRHSTTGTVALIIREVTGIPGRKGADDIWEAQKLHVRVKWPRLGFARTSTQKVLFEGYSPPVKQAKGRVGPPAAESDIVAARAHETGGPVVPQQAVDDIADERDIDYGRDRS